MALFWLVHEIDGPPRVFVAEGNEMIFARLRASMAGFAGTFVEAHRLDDRTARRVPKKMIGRCRIEKQAEARTVDALWRVIGHIMKPSRFTEEQIIGILREQEAERLRLGDLLRLRAVHERLIP